MSTRGFSTNIETLLFLAWAARAGLQEAMREAHNQRLTDKTRNSILCDPLTSGLSSVFEFDSVYGPVYRDLFAYRLNQVDFLDVSWALRGYNAVYLEDQVVEREECAPSTPETDLLWQSITGNEHLLDTIKRMSQNWKGDVRRGANALRLHFTILHMPLVTRTVECAFLIYEFVTQSLEQVNWVALASLSLGIPYMPQPPLQDEEKEGNDEAMQLALIEEVIWNSFVDLSVLGQHTLFPQLVRDLCTDLADQCYQVHTEICNQEENGAV